MRKFGRFPSGDAERGGMGKVRKSKKDSSLKSFAGTYRVFKSHHLKGGRNQSAIGEKYNAGVLKSYISLL